MCFVGMLMSPDIGRNSQICDFLKNIAVTFIPIKRVFLLNKANWFFLKVKLKLRIPCSNREKCHFRASIFKILPGEYASPQPPRNLAASAFGHDLLFKLVKTPTRGQNILDLVSTNLHKYYNQPEILPPIGNSDHNVALISPNNIRHKGKKSKVLICDTCRANKQLLLEKLKTVNFNPVLYQASRQQKYGYFDRTLMDIMDETLPF